MIKMNMHKPNGAIFSNNKMMRFLLWRTWEPCLPKVLFIGLNPSIAGVEENDPTIRRVINFAKDWGYGGIYMMNLFPYIATNPKDLLISNRGLKKNHLYLWKYSQDCKEVIFAWGAYNKFPDNRDEADFVAEMFPNAKCLIKNKDGSPRHPLYVLSVSKPINFKENVNKD